MRLNNSELLNGKHARVCHLQQQHQRVGSAGDVATRDGCFYPQGEHSKDDRKRPASRVPDPGAGKGAGVLRLRLDAAAGGRPTGPVPVWGNQELVRCPCTGRSCARLVSGHWLQRQDGQGLAVGLPQGLWLNRPPYPAEKTGAAGTSGIHRVVGGRFPARPAAASEGGAERQRLAAGEWRRAPGNSCRPHRLPVHGQWPAGEQAPSEVCGRHCLLGVLPRHRQRLQPAGR